MKRVDVAIAIIQRDQKLLVCQRKEGDSFGGYWEFPGGKREGKESLQNCVLREIREELGIEVAIRDPIDPLEHDYEHVKIRLHPFICDYLSGEPQLLAVQAFRWIQPAELRNYQFPEANGGLIDDLMDRFSRRKLK